MSADDNYSVLAEDVRFRYAADAGSPDDRPFGLRIADWQVERGDRVALYGPSGCGKSTLLNLIAGVLPLAEGRLRVEGADLNGLPDAERRAHRIRNIGFVFQDFPLVDYLDVLENVLFPYRLNPALSLDAEARWHASGLLDELGLGAMKHRHTSALSQGERQRVAIARALVTSPSLLLADEPTAGLDPERGQEVYDLLESLSRSRRLTLLLVTHDPQLRARAAKAWDISQWVLADPEKGRAAISTNAVS